MSLEVITPRKRKPSLFSDLRADMSQNPITGDLALRRDEEAVKESLKNLILTDKGERLMRPLIGGNIKAMLFENKTPAVLKMIEIQIRNTIEEYEPRAELIDVVVNSTADSNSVRVDIRFYLLNSENPTTATIFIERTR
jgi:phage baseplate assembly protein W